MKIIHIIIAFTLLFAGCLFPKLRKNIEQVNSLFEISGTVKNESKSNHPIIVLLIKVSDGVRKFDGYDIIYGEDLFTFYRPYGAYILFAFEDTNEDLAFQINEPMGVCDSSSLKIDNENNSLTNLEIQLNVADSVKFAFAEMFNMSEINLKIERQHIKEGVIVDFSDSALSEQSGHLGMWEPAIYLSNKIPGIYFLEEYDSLKTPVLLVHGIGGYGQEWQYLAENIDTSKFQPWVVAYPSGLRLDQIGKAMAQSLLSLRLKYKFKDINIIAHSMGGLVTLSMLNHNNDLQTPVIVKNYITISTPWEGHENAKRGIERAPAIVPSWYDMVPGSNLQKNIIKKGVPKNINYNLIFSYKTSGNAHLPVNNDGSVALSSQLSPKMQSIAEKVVGFNEDHTSILKSKDVLIIINNILDSKNQKE